MGTAPDHNEEIDMMRLCDVVRWAIKPETLEIWDQIAPRKTSYFAACLPPAKVEILLSVPPFQVERITIPANVEIPKHRHPRMESWEYLLYGNGLVCVRHRRVEVENDTLRRLQFVPRDAWHVGGTGDMGASWLSIQQWFGELTSSGIDWEQEGA